MNRYLCENHTISGKYILAPIEDIITPKEGRVVFMERWWNVTEDDKVLFYRSYASPQCNSNKRIADHLCDYRDIKTKTVFIPVAFCPDSRYEE